MRERKCCGRETNFFLNARKKDWLGSKRRINAGNPGCILRVNAFATRLSCSWPFRDVATGGFRGRHLFFVLLFLHREGPTQDKRRRGRGTQKRKGTKIFLLSLLRGKTNFSCSSRAAAVGFARVSSASSLSSIDGDSMLIDAFLKSQICILTHSLSLFYYHSHKTARTRYRFAQPTGGSRSFQAQT